MKFLLDESAELRLAAFLKEHGHDVTAVAIDYQASIRDEQVLAIAQAEGRILITNDTDFGELVFRKRQPHSGVILFRFLDLPLSDKIAALQQLLDEHPHQLEEFVVVAPGSIRIRSSEE
jgi:predicted nuclease of predicted toxin-antitoxin system